MLKNKIKQQNAKLKEQTNKRMGISQPFIYLFCLDRMTLPLCM